MNIFTISGSATQDSSNSRLLKALPTIIKEHQFFHFERLMDFPLFTPERNNSPNELVLSFKEKISMSDMVVISFPEYVHNIPAVLKNAFEWVTSSGEFDTKKVLLVSFTPSSPRGEYAMQSVIWSLKALNAKIIAELPLYRSELKITKDGVLIGNSSVEAIKTMFEFVG